MQKWSVKSASLWIPLMKQDRNASSIIIIIIIIIHLFAINIITIIIMIIIINIITVICLAACTSLVIANSHVCNTVYAIACPCSM